MTHEKKAQVLINCGGIYDPTRLETVLRVTFPKIGDHERKQGVLPQRGHDSRDGKTRPGGGKGFGKFGRKPGFSKNRVHEVEQCEGQEDEPED